MISDRRVPVTLKALPVLTLLYLIWPIDLVSELLVPVIGPLVALDDLGIILLWLNAFISLAPPQIVAEHERELAGEAGWRVVEDEGTSPPAGDTTSADAPPPMVEGFYRIVDDEKN